MKCQDIALVLDDADWRRLPLDLQRDAESHVARCTECARDWQLQTALAGVVMPELRPAVVGRLRATMVTPSARRSRSAYVVVGGLAALAAAAAAFIYGPHGGGGAVGRASSDAGSSVVDKQSLPAQVDALQASASASASASAPAAVQPSSSQSSVFTPPGVSFTVRVLPPVSSTNDALSLGALQRFQARLLSELAAIPGLSLSETASGEPETPEADFEVTSTGDRHGDGDTLRMMVRLRRTAPPALVQPFRADFTPSCVHPSDTGSRTCSDADTAAASVVRGMRALMFPLDSADRSRLEAEVADSSRDLEARLEALRALTRIRGPLSYQLSAYVGDQHPLSTPGAISGAVALASAGSTQQRIAVWQMLRGVRRTELVDPLIAAAQSDPDEKVRKEALLGLVTDFPAEPRARQALERIARQDDSPFLRALADRAISGEGSWRKYVSTTLSDVQRRPEERLEALLYDLNDRVPAATRGESALAQMLDEEGIAALGDALPAGLSSSLRRQVLVDIVSRLGGLNHPSITNALIRATELDLAPSDRVLIVTQLVRRNADARVGLALQTIAASDPDPKIRELAAEGIRLPSVSR